jgi:hypothetical protein
VQGLKDYETNLALFYQVTSQPSTEPQKFAAASAAAIDAARLGLFTCRGQDCAPGVGTPVRGGATYREAHLAMEIIADHGRMLSFEIVEVNPVIDEHNQTADLAVELALSAFGKKIL